MKTIAVITSGGDCQGMNQVLFSLTKAALAKGIKVVGFYRGYEGILKNDKVKLNLKSIFKYVDQGGSVLKSSRCMAMHTKEGQEQVVNNLKKNKVDGLVVIGGDGSAKGAEVLYKEYNIPTVVIPATIDNDIEGVKLSLGYLSAIDRATTQMSWISDTAKSHDRIFIVEVMGRHSGNLAKGISKEIKPLATVLPDTKVDEKLIKQIENKFNKNQSNIVVITELQPQKIKELEEILKLKYDVRVNSLGHGQRGGPPTKEERKLATKYALQALKNLLKNNLGMVKNLSI